MKRKLSLIALVAILGLSCGKPSETLTPDYGNEYGDLKYTIDGVKDLTMERIGEGSMTLYVNRTAGKIEDVALSVRNLPAGATVTFLPTTIAYPSFNTTLTIKATRVKAGKYDVVVRGSSQSSGFTDYNMVLNVLPYSNAAIGLEGQFKEQSKCSQGGDKGHTVSIERDDTQPNRIDIKGLWSGVWSNIVYANLNPSNNTLEIPAQIINGVTFSGSGTFEDNTIIISYKVTGATVNDNCSATLSRL